VIGKISHVAHPRVKVPLEAVFEVGPEMTFRPPVTELELLAPGEKKLALIDFHKLSL